MTSAFNQRLSFFLYCPLSLLRRAESQPVLGRVHKTVDHRARVGWMTAEIVEPALIAVRVRLASEITVILHPDKRIIELSRAHLIRIGNRAEDLRPRERAVIERRRQAAARERYFSCA